MRGNVPRAQIIITSRKNILPKKHSHDGKNDGPHHPPRNNVEARPENAMAPRYSPRKNSANLKPEYSVWKPATISDSPSARSNGERLSSAMPAMKNATKPTRPHGFQTNQWENVP